MRSTSIMCPDRQRGFALVSAIFILVVLAALGGFIVTISTSQHIGGALDVQGARAYQAARAGVEWGVYQVLKVNTNACPAASTNLPALAADLAEFGVTVTCSKTHGPATCLTTGTDDDVCVYQIEATACSPANGGACPNTDAAVVGTTSYVERRIRMTVTN